MTCTSCQQSRGLRGISEDVMLALSAGDVAAQERLRGANGLAIWGASQLGGATSAIGGAVIGFAAAGSSRGAATGALLSYGIESSLTGGAMLFAGTRIDGARALTVAGGLSLLCGLAANIGGVYMAYRNYKRRGRR